MEPVTHFLTGAVLARTGFNRKAAYATLAMTLAAEAPDIDYIYRIGGPLPWFQHHRGWTHSLLGLPVIALAVLGIVWLVHRWRLKRGKATVAPVRWGLLFGFTLIALLSHLLLDYTNNYGIRPFAPFNPRWYAASIVFIAEPLLWLVLIAALILPPIFALAASEVGARKQPFRGQGLAIAALVLMLSLWMLRTYEHARAVTIAQQNELSSEPLLHTDANPYPITPFRWQVILETPMQYRLGTVDTLTGQFTQFALIHKPPTTLFTLIAKRSWLGEIYLDWSKFPVVEEVAKDPTLRSVEPNTEVTFTDLRFRYPSTFLNGRMGRTLVGIVEMNDDRRIVGMTMDDQPQLQ